MQVLLCVVVFFFANVVNLETETPTIVFINSLVDLGLVELSKTLSKNNFDTIPLPDIDYIANEKLPKIRLAMSEGSFGKTTSLKRSGDVFLIMDGNSLILNLTATFEDAVFHFGKFEGDFGILKLSDELKANVNTNEIHAQASLLLTESGFKITLNDLELTKLQDIRLERKKKGVIQRDPIDATMTFAFNKFHEKLRVLLGGLLKGYLNDLLKEHDIF